MTLRPGPLEVLVVLPVAVEPLTAATTLGARDDVVLDAVIAAVDADRLEDDLVERSPPACVGYPPTTPGGHGQGLVTLDRDPGEALQALDACLLTNAELADGEEDTP